MIFRALRRRVADALEGYRWLWRASHAHARSPLSGTLRFLALALEDLVLLGAWSASIPLRQPVQRHRVVVPALALLLVLMLSLDTPPGPETSPFGDRAVPQSVGAACGGGVTLGAIASPGDEIVAFEACADAFTTIEADCDDCRNRGAKHERLFPEFGLWGLST